MASAPGSQLTRRLAGTVAEACDRMFDPTPGGGSHPLEALVEKVRDGASRNMGAAGHVLDGGHAVRPAQTPVALIENGTTSQERRVVGTLATIEQQAMQAALEGPTLCMIGEVIGLALPRDPEFHFVSGIGL